MPSTGLQLPLLGFILGKTACLFLKKKKKKSGEERKRGKKRTYEPMVNLINITGGTAIKYLTGL